MNALVVETPKIGSTNFHLRAAPEQIDELLAEFDANLPSDWVRDFEAEGRAVEFFGEPSRHRYYLLNGPTGPLVSWCLIRISPDNLDSGPAILLSSPSNISGEARMRALQLIRHSLAPLIGHLGISIEYPTPRHPAETAFGDDARLRLLEFSASAPRQEKFGPGDEKRWSEFLVAAHRSTRVADGDDLKDWLLRQGFAKARVDELSSQYGLTFKLLETYDAELLRKCP